MTAEILRCYRVLELESGTSLEQVKQAYRMFAKVWHPDRFPNDAKLQSKGQEKLKELNAAYRILEEFLTQEKVQVPQIGRVWTIPHLALTMQPIAAGMFTMGSPQSEPCRFSVEGPQTKVTISQPFWLAKTAVTHGQWKALMGSDLHGQCAKTLTDRSPSTSAFAQFQFNDADNLPMFFVSWDEAMEFCRRMTAREQAAGRLPTGYKYRLPTEAEWEYACRAGTTTATYAGKIEVKGQKNAPVLDSIAWYGGNSSVGYTGNGLDTSKAKHWAEKQYPGGAAGPRAVATKEPNDWGLHDMLGNVFEWCLDDFEWHLKGGTAVDPLQRPSGALRVHRGGSWFGGVDECRAAFRVGYEPGYRCLNLGFRLALGSDRLTST